MNWEDKSRLKRLGEKHDLVSLEGHWMRPIKYSVEGEEEIRLAQLKLGEHYPRGVLRKLAKKYKDIETMRPQEMIAKLDDEDLEELLDQTKSFKAGEQATYKKLVLLHGIGEHNFENGEGKLEEVTEDFVGRLCANKELAGEMQEIAEVHNRPLAKGSGLKSGIQQNGSVKEPNSKKTNSSRTKVIRPS